MKNDMNVAYFFTYFHSMYTVVNSHHISPWISNTELIFFLKKIYSDKLHIIFWKKHNHRHELQKLRQTVYRPLVLN